MKASGLNSIEYVLHLIGCTFKIVGYILLVLIVGPVLYLLWSWNTMKFQDKAIDALNAAPRIEVTLDFNQCLLVPKDNQTLVVNAVKVEADQVEPMASEAWMWHWLPWAPGMPPDRTENNLTTSYGGYEGMYLDHYRRATDIPHADPWYYHGLLKLAPTKHWDDGTGVDYVFGKVAGNYQAYVAAMRAVLTIRYLLGGMAAGVPPDSLASLAQQAGDAQLAGPVAAYRVAGATRLSAFLRGYNTDFNGQLPVVHLDLQKFDDSTWGGLRGLCKDGVEWDNRMGWWGGPGAGSGTLPDNSRDYFITGLATRRNPLGCRPQFTPADFLLNHMPELTPGQRAAQAELRRVTTDAFWDSLLSADLRSDAHILLNVVRKDLDHDYRFARKYGFIMFQGDKFGRGTSIMKE